MGKNGNKVTISVCMMIKHGGRLFREALESVSDLADEIIVVNTDDHPDPPAWAPASFRARSFIGNGPGDVAVAREFKAKVYHHPWQRDFSLHRNQSMGYATKDWLLILDADERFALPEGVGPRRLKKKLASFPDSVGAAGCWVVDFRRGAEATRFWSIRLFRRGHGRYVHKVHNEAEHRGGLKLLRDVQVHHFGYDLDAQTMRAKFDRSYPLLLARVRENPEDYQALYLLSHLCGEYGRDDESVEWGLTYLKNREKAGAEFNRHAWFTVARRLQEMGHWDDSLALIQKGLADDPINLDLSVALSEYGVHKKQPEFVADGARRYLAGFKALAEDPKSLGTAFTHSYRKSVYLMQLSRLVSATLAEGAGALRMLQPHLKETPALARDMKEFLGQLGLGGLLEPEKERSNLIILPERPAVDLSKLGILARNN